MQSIMDCMDDFNNSWFSKVEDTVLTLLDEPKMCFFDVKVLFVFPLLFHV